MDVDRRGCRFPALGSALQQCQQSARGTLVVPLAATTRRAFPVAPTAPGPRQRPRPRERGRAGRGNSRATSIHSSPPGLSRYFRRPSRIATSWARSEGRMLSPRAGSGDTGKRAWVGVGILLRARARARARARPRPRASVRARLGVEPGLVLVPPPRSHCARVCSRGRAALAARSSPRLSPAMHMRRTRDE